MPIRIPGNLPAFETLTKKENIFVISTQRADTQNIRPLKIAILNLMPTKIVTETQLLRLLSNTPLQVDIEFLTVKSHTSKNTPKTHMDTFYKVFDDFRHSFFDGMIITGAPVELIPFESVDYWREFTDIMEWSKGHVFSTLHICWGAQAGLFYHYGIEKHVLENKLSGVFSHRAIVENVRLLKGFNDIFSVPHSRCTEVRREDIGKRDELEIIVDSDIAGVHIVRAKNDRQYFLMGHCEYDRETLALEYKRDIDNKVEGTAVPFNYFPQDDPERLPPFVWCCHANLLFSNWLNYCVYQLTPYDLTKIPEFFQTAENLAEAADFGAFI